MIDLLKKSVPTAHIGHMTLYVVQDKRFGDAAGHCLTAVFSAPLLENHTGKEEIVNLYQTPDPDYTIRTVEFCDGLFMEAVAPRMAEYRAIVAAGKSPLLLVEIDEDGETQAVFSSYPK